MPFGSVLKMCLVFHVFAKMSILQTICLVGGLWLVAHLYQLGINIFHALTFVCLLVYLFVSLFVCLVYSPCLSFLFTNLLNFFVQPQPLLYMYLYLFTFNSSLVRSQDQFCSLLCLCMCAQWNICHFAFEKEPARFETYGQ